MFNIDDIVEIIDGSTTAAPIGSKAIVTKATYYNKYCNAKLVEVKWLERNGHNQSNGGYKIKVFKLISTAIIPIPRFEQIVQELTES